MSNQEKYSGENSNMVVDYIVELGLDHFKDKILQEREDKIIRERLKKFLEGQSRINDLSSLEEEIDFEGLADYIRRDLIDDVQLYLFGNWRERDRAKTSILNKAVTYSQAHTSVSRRRAIEFTETAIELLRYYYRSVISRDLKLIATEIEDTVEDSVERLSAKQTEELKSFVAEQAEQVVRELTDVFDRNNSLSIDRGSQLIQMGNIEQVEIDFQNYLKSISGIHSLSPYYGFGYNGNRQKLYSRPFTQEALEKYPPRISCTGTAQMDGRYIERLDWSTIDYANRHQLPIILNVVTAKKFLGDFVDPVQYEAEDLVGENFTIPPTPFPPAIPCSISLDDEVMFEYVLFRTEEILDDGTIIISNSEQLKIPYRIKLMANLSTKETTYSVCTETPNNREMLQYLKFLKRASLGAEIKVKVLSGGEDFAKGKTGKLDYETGFDTIDNEIDFVEKIVAIEQYFGDSIHIPEEINQNYYYTVSYLAALIRGEESTGGWSKLEFDLTLTEDLKQKIAESDNLKFTLSYVGSISVTLFDKAYELSAIRVFESVVYQNIERLKQKAAVLDVDDTIKLTFLPGDGENGTWKDRLYMEELEETGE